MKDEQDRIIQLIPATAANVPQAHADVSGIPSKVLINRDYRQRQGLVTFLPVSMVAMEWGVSSRRIRALLCAGRLEGTRHENGYWDVHYPYRIIEGRRGPVMRKYSLKNSERRSV
jgi:hypothetical protein